MVVHVGQYFILKGSKKKRTRLSVNLEKSGIQKNCFTDIIPHTPSIHAASLGLTPITPVVNAVP